MRPMFSLISPFVRDDVRSPYVRALSDYWDAMRVDRRVPDRDDIDIADLRNVLPYMMVVDIEPNPFRVFYRLAGTKVVELNGMELKGSYLDQLAGDQIEFIQSGLQAYRTAWENQEAVFGAYRWHTPSGAECDVEFGIFPVTYRGEASQCIAVEDWDVGESNVLRHERPPPMIKNTPALSQPPMPPCPSKRPLEK